MLLMTGAKVPQILIHFVSWNANGKALLEAYGDDSSTGENRSEFFGNPLSI